VPSNHFQNSRAILDAKLIRRSAVGAVFVFNCGNGVPYVAVTYSIDGPLVITVSAGD